MMTGAYGCREVPGMRPAHVPAALIGRAPVGGAAPVGRGGGIRHPFAVLNPERALPAERRIERPCERCGRRSGDDSGRCAACGAQAARVYNGRPVAVHAAPVAALGAGGRP